MTLTTNLGTLAVEIDVEKVPCTAASFTFLASKAYFDNTTCHRLVTKPLAILQCGDPSGTGSGGPGYRFDDENLPEVLRQGAPTDRTVLYPAGTLAMANYGADTNGSQFFIVYEDTVLPADHPVVGSLSEGIELVRRVAAGGVIACDSRGPDDGVPKTTLSITTLRMSQAG
ncbi:MAG: peptidylprolyl isomerase [Micromonosporaceae bacterium]|nr:peptidylprolyl isomerase [Micromonosporaceae bacterium]